jgi:hypothetical protein
MKAFLTATGMILGLVVAGAGVAYRMGAFSKDAAAGSTPEFDGDGNLVNAHTDSPSGIDSERVAEAL